MNEITKSNTETMVYRILVVRGHRVLLDRDLAECYKVATKALNQAVRRHPERFPGDFAFRLTQEEKETYKKMQTTTEQISELLQTLEPAMQEQYQQYQKKAADEETTNLPKQYQQNQLSEEELTEDVPLDQNKQHHQKDK